MAGFEMRRRVLEEHRGVRVVMVDTIAHVQPDNASHVVVCGSHGGVSSGEYAARVPVAAVFFNDAGGGKENVGHASLAYLDARGIAAEHPPALVVFNDAGGGKNGAGVASLADLEREGIAAAAVAHDSARIGDALDAWENGVVSHANAPAREYGVRPGRPLREEVQNFSSNRRTTEGVQSEWIRLANGCGNEQR